jgi:PEP-CTERM motif
MKSFAFAAAAALSLATPSVSHAVTVDITSSGFSNGSKSGVLHLTGSAFDGQTASFGQFKLDGVYSPGGSPVTFFTYCVDLYHSLIIPGTFTIQPLTSIMTAAKADDITKLLFYNSPTTDVQSAAIQLAVWEIAFEGTAIRNVDAGALAGTFFASAGDSATARSTANTYLANLGALAMPTGVTATVLYAQNNQIQVFLSPVPEAATWGMMIIGFGIVGASLRRRAKLSYRIA